MGKAALDFGGGVGEEHFGMALYPSSIQVLSASQEGQYLILYTGATDHVFPRRDQFHSYDSNVPLSCKFVRTADNRPHQVMGVGIVAIHVTTGERKFYFGLRSLHVPSLGQNLVSINKLNKGA